MTAIAALAENWTGTVGNTPTTGTTGADAITGAATHTFSNDFTYNGHNMLKVVAAANSRIYRYDYTPAGGGWRGFAFVKAGNPSANVAIAVSEDASAVKGCDLRLNTDGTLSLRDAGSATRWTSTTVLANNTKYWIAMRVNSAGNGGHRVKIYDGTTGALIEDSGAQTNAGFSLAAPARFKIGPQASVTLTAYWGQMLGDDTNEMTVPVIVSVTAVSTIVHESVIDASASTGAVTTLTKTSGTEGTITSIGTNIWKVTYSQSRPDDIVLVVHTETSGVSDEDTYTIPASAAVVTPVSARKTRVTGGWAAG